MIRVALKGLLGRKLRATLTAFAIVLGVAMVSGSFVLTDTIQKGFDSASSDLYQNADVVVSSENAISSGMESGLPPGFSEDVLRDVRSLPDVAGTFASVGGPVGLVGRDGKAIGRGGSATSADPTGDQSLNQLELVRGEWPRGEGEIAIDRSTAEDEHYDVGGTIGAFGDGPVRQFRIAGIVAYSSSEPNGQGTTSVFDLPTAQRLLDKRGKLDGIQVAARDGVSAAKLTEEIRPLLPETAQARTAEAQVEKASSDTAKSLGSLRTILLAFGGIALFVGSFVIANTMSITVSQRMRELATLRTLGASRRQVLRSVVLEAVVVGVLASIAGLFLGLGLAQGLISLLEALGLGLPGGGLVFATRTVVVSITVGTVIALVASLRPALRATHVEPIAAVREGATLPASRLSRYGLVTSLGVVALAVVLLGYGVFAHGLATGARMLSLGGGSVLLFIGVALIAPRLVRPLVAVLGAPGASIGGAAGELARNNARRNPSRTASTAAALMIGLALITFVAIVGQGLRSSFVDAVDKQFVADYAVLSSGNPVSDKAARAVATAPGVETVSEIRRGSARSFGHTVAVNGVDGSLTKVIDMTWHRGSDEVPAGLGRDGAFVAEEYANSHHLALGSHLRLKTPTGQVLRLKVEGIFEEPTKGNSPFGRVAMSIPTYDTAFPGHENEFTFVNVRGGPTAANTANLNRALSAFPDADVQTRDEFKDAQISDLKTILNIVYALLGLSVIVSLFGIVNTLVLSVFERTRELGMLRAIGMTRRQARRMIRHESIVTALIGATFGIAVGIFLAALVTHALSDQGFVFAVPYKSLGAFVAVAVVAGMIAAILPARRAARLNVLEALQYE
jgi:putative ABC transport system permease protein